MTASSGVYGGRKILEGIVVSDKMEKTVVVSVEERMRHRLYKKTVKRQRKFMAHDEELHPQMGDVVRIVEARPMSRRKRWVVIEVLQRVELPEVAPESIDLELLGEVKPPVVEEPEAPEATAAAVADEAPETEAVEEAAEPEAAATVVADEAAETEAVEEVAEPEAAAADEPEAAADEPEEAVAEAEVAVEEPEAVVETEAEPVIEETTDETTEAEATTEDEEEKASDPAVLPAEGRRQLRRAPADVHPGARWLAPPLRHRRRHHRRLA